MVLGRWVGQSNKWGDTSSGEKLCNSYIGRYSPNSHLPNMLVHSWTTTCGSQDLCFDKVHTCHVYSTHLCLTKSPYMQTWVYVQTQPLETIPHLTSLGYYLYLNEQFRDSCSIKWKYNKTSNGLQANRVNRDSSNLIKMASNLTSTRGPFLPIRLLSSSELDPRSAISKKQY